MKIIKECRIGGKDYDLASCHIVLELNNTGRGYIVIESDADLIKKSVEIEIGSHDYFYRYFTGFVEQSQDEQPGFKKLFIRELAAIFERPLNCSLRHATIKDVCAWIQAETGIIFKSPDSAYATTPIPNFTHSGSGYQLLNNIGRLFSVPQYMWQQSPDGSIFVGSHNDSRWHGKNLEIDNGETLDSGNNQMTLPIYAAIRPGAIINNKNINKTELQDDNLTLFWDDLDNAGKPKQKSPNRRMLEKNFPELAGGYHLPRYARVTGVADPSGGGDIADPFRPKYAVELQLLDEDGNDDTTTPVYSAVPLPVTSTGSQGGDFAFPEVGTVVEIGYAYGRPDKPFVRTMLAQNKTVPSVAVGEQLKQQRPEVYERTDAAGNKTRETDQTITDRSFVRVVEADSEQKTIGTSTSDVDADKTVNVGGNLTTSVIGNIDEATASNKSVGVAGELSERINGTSQRLSDVKNRIVAPLSYMGSEGQNIFRILEKIIQNQADIAGLLANHTHQGPKSDQASQFSSYQQKANAEKAKLTPIIE